jgi:hypothetical protein
MKTFKTILFLFAMYFTFTFFESCLLDHAEMIRNGVKPWQPQRALSGFCACLIWSALYYFSKRRKISVTIMMHKSFLKQEKEEK